MLSPSILFWTVVTREVARSLVLDLHLTCSHYVLSGTNRNDLLVLGDTDLHFSVDDHKFVANVSVLPAIDHFLLSRLVDNKCKRDFADGYHHWI